MEVMISIEERRLQIKLEPSKEERNSVYGAKMETDLSFKIASDEDVNFHATHPDHLALIVLLAAHPFSTGELNIPLHVSESFATACKIFERYKPTFSSTNSLPYTPRSNSRPGLAFSGGVDSTAALELMPESTVPVFLDRPVRAKTTLYNKSAAKATLAFLEARDIPNISVTTDVEFIRNPIGFPTDLAAGIPAIALATHLNFDSIGYGTIMESAYRIGHVKAREYSTSPHYKVWGPLFAACGIPLYLPVAGVSEVGTSIILHGSEYRGMARSCIRGEWPKRCDLCWKCFRKQLIEMALVDRSISESELYEDFKKKEVLYKIKSPFISHENVLAWALSKMKREGFVDLFFNRLVGSTYNLDHLETYLPRSIELIPSQYRLTTVQNLRKYLLPMKSEDQIGMLEQDFTNYMQSGVYESLVKNFENSILS